MALAACGGTVSPPLDGGVDGGPGMDGGDSGVADAGALKFKTEIPDVEAWAALSSTRTPGVKYLAPIPGRQAPAVLDRPVYFQNMRLYSWHLAFLQSFAGLGQLSYSTYVSLVLTPRRALWGGSVVLLPGVTHPLSHRTGVAAYDLYTEPSAIDDAAVRGSFTALSSAAPALSDLLVFVPDRGTQGGWAESGVGRLLGEGIPIVLPEALSSIDAQTYVRGETYGRLRLGGTAGPREVWVVSELPAAAGMVAGLITAARHPADNAVDQALAARGAPSLALTGAVDDSVIGLFADQPVHLVAQASGLVLEPVPMEDVEAFWSGR